MQVSRRDFIKSAASSAAGLTLRTYVPSYDVRKMPGEKITIADTSSNFEREPLIRPFGFKGGYMREIWQTAAMLKSEKGIRKIGLCSQSVLWSDAEVFASHSESGGNALMFSMTEYALNLLKGYSFADPVSLLEELWPEVHEYGKKVCRKGTLRQTFALNSLVGVDNAAWLLYASENGIERFDELIPEKYRSAFSLHHKKLACIPLMSYTVPADDIRRAVDEGYFFIKIKIGQPGTQSEMLEKDKARIEEIHHSIGNRETPYTSDRRIPYYFDANGRYESRDTLMRLLDHAEKIGALKQIAILEEPFAEHLEFDVRDIPVRLAADESAHTEKDAQARIQMGYKAIALKPIAKTLSMTLKIAAAAANKGIPCFCADLTVNPILVDWNKNIAARLAPFPGFDIGLIETNGHQNYKNWDIMKGYHPCNEESWTKVKNGIFDLSGNFYSQSGGIFKPSEHYEKMFSNEG